MEIAKKKDFVELKFTGYSNGSIFDSNVDEDLKKIEPEAKPRETIIVVGERMVVQGLDNALREKKLEKITKLAFLQKKDSEREERIS